MKILYQLSSKFLLFQSLTIVLALPGVAQKSVPGFILQNIEKMSDSTTLFFHSSVEKTNANFEVLDLTSRVSFNSSYPRGFNDGPVWRGNGLTLEVHGGVAGKKGKFSYQFMPTVFFSQNSSFELAPRNTEVNNELAYQFTNRIDWVQKYGSSSELFFHPGQSEIKFQAGKFITTLSTQNYSAGPSSFNPILLSQQGGGFPHLRIGSEPFTVNKIGGFEVNLLAGLLSESDYYDSDNENDNRLFNGLFINYAPSFLPNFKIGAGKVLYKQTQFFELEDVLALLVILEEKDREGFDAGNDTFDQMASIFAEWSFPAVGFRAYGEFAKNDFTGSTRWTLVEPEHARGYTIGFEKVTQTKSGKEVKIIYEHTNLSTNQAFLWRATPPFYTHGVNRQGYTHNGQLLGAGIGPGGNSDNLLIQKDNLENQTIGLRLQRIENNRDYFVRNIADLESHDIEYSFGIFAFKKRRGKASFVGELTYSHNFNRYYLNDQSNLFLLVGTSIDL